MSIPNAGPDIPYVTTVPTSYIGPSVSVAGVLWEWRDGAYLPSVTRRALVPIAYFGPSTADNGVGVCDALTDYTPTFPGSGSTFVATVRNGVNESAAAPGAYLRASAGISGENVQQTADRSKAVYSASRKSALDVVNSGAHVVIYRSSSINTIGQYSSIATDGEIAAQVAKEIALIQYFIAKGLFVIFVGPYGYSPAVSAELLAVRRDAVIRYQAAYKTACQSIPRVAYIDPQGLTCNGDGSIIASCSDDGLHLNQVGGFVLYAEEQKYLTKYTAGAVYPKTIFDCDKAFYDTADTTSFTVAHSGGNTGAIVRGSLSPTCDVAAAAGGFSQFSFNNADLLACFTGSDKKFLLVFDVDIYRNGILVSSDLSTKVALTLQITNGGNIYYTSEIRYRGGKYCMPVVIPSASVPTAAVASIKITSAAADAYTAKFGPLLVCKAPTV